MAAYRSTPGRTPGGGLIGGTTGASSALPSATDRKTGRAVNGSGCSGTPETNGGARVRGRGALAGGPQN
eukprot:11157495-Lingulodinium_polyedra.AAC.1